VTKQSLAILAFSVVSVWNSAFGEMELFTNEAGQSIRAELIELSSDQKTIKLKTERGVTMNADLKAFTLSDQKRIKAWWAGILAEAEILSSDDRLEISVKMNRKSKGNQYDNYYRIDDETKTYFPEVIIENLELQTFKGNQLRVVIFADDLYTKGQKLIVSAFTLKSDFYDRGRESLEGTPFRLRTYEYDSSYSSYEYKNGYEYDGYAVIIKNSKGEITHTKASRSAYLNYLKNMYKCRAGQVYTDDLQHKLDVSPNSYYYIK